MDMMGKAMFSHQVDKFSKGLGLGDDEEKQEESTYDPRKEAEEEAKLADQRARRQEQRGKRQVERAANRNKIREKYGLKQSKHDQSLMTQKGEESTAQPAQQKESSLTRTTPSREKKDEKCSVM